MARQVRRVLACLGSVGCGEVRQGGAGLVGWGELRLGSEGESRSGEAGEAWRGTEGPGCVWFGMVWQAGKVGKVRYVEVRQGRLFVLTFYMRGSWYASSKRNNKEVSKVCS